MSERNDALEAFWLNRKVMLSAWRVLPYLTPEEAIEEEDGTYRAMGQLRFEGEAGR